MSISVNSKIIICYCPKECSALHWWAKQNDVYNKRCQHVYTFLKFWAIFYNFGSEKNKIEPYSPISFGK